MLPAVTIVICTYDHPLKLERCLTSLAQQTYPIELIRITVIDDGSHQAEYNQKVVASFPELSSKYSYISHSGLPVARQRAIELLAPQCSVVGLIDDDCVAASDWIATGVQTLVTTTHSAVVGRVESLISKRTLVTDFHKARGTMRTWHKENDRTTNHILTGNVFFRTQALRKTGLVNPIDLVLAQNGIILCGGDDRDLANRMLQSGMTIGYNHHMLVWHEHRHTLIGLLLQVYGYGRSVTLRQMAMTLAGCTYSRDQMTEFTLGHNLRKVASSLPHRIKKVYTRSHAYFGPPKAALLSCIEALRFISFHVGVLSACVNRRRIKTILKPMPFS